MKIRERQEIKNKINDLVGDIVELLEENRHEPAGRGAGTAPSESSINESSDIIFKFIEYILSSGITKDELSKEITLEEIIQEIISVQDDNIADYFEDLKEVDQFNRDNGETKYRYENTVYEHKPTKKHICVECQRGVGDWDGIISSVNVNEVFKKEITKYEWV